MGDASFLAALLLTVIAIVAGIAATRLVEARKSHARHGARPGGIAVSE